MSSSRASARAVEHHHPSYAPGQELAVTPLCASCHTRETAGDGADARRRTVATIRAAGGAMTAEAFVAATGTSKATASRRLTDAEAAGLLTREGRGGRSGPQVWRATTGT